MRIDELSSQTEAVSQSTSSVREQLVQSLRTSKDYRHAFVEEKIRTGLAAQVKAIREQRGITQTMFARMLAKSQSWVARLEDPNESAPTISTLLRVAHAFDVDLQVRFAPFSESADWVSGLPHTVPGLSSLSLAVPDFDHDAALEPVSAVPGPFNLVSRAWIGWVTYQSPESYSGVYAPLAEAPTVEQSQPLRFVNVGTVSEVLQEAA